MTGAQDKIETSRVAGLILVIVPMAVVLLFGVAAWSAVPLAAVMTVGLLVTLWCQMVQDHSPRRQ